MISFLTARADITFFGKTAEKEDIVPIEYQKSENTISFTLNKTEFVIKLIELTKVFAINNILATEKQIDLCEKTEGAVKDKFELTGFQKKECRSIDCPCISNASVYECQINTIENKGEEVKIVGTIILHKK